MATPTGSLSLIPLTTRYWDYFARTETDTFRGHYTSFLDPYAINPVDSDADADADAAPANVARLIYSAAQ